MVAHFFLVWRNNTIRCKQAHSYWQDTLVNISGFLLYSSVNCGATFRDSKGVITSPNYPNKYPKNRACFWVITSPVGYKVRHRWIHLSVSSLFSDETSVSLKNKSCYVTFSADILRAKIWKQKFILRIYAVSWYLRCSARGNLYTCKWTLMNLACTRLCSK